MKKLAIGTLLAGNDVEIYNEPQSGIGQYGPIYDVETNSSPVLKKRLKKIKEKMEKKAVLESGKAEDEENSESPKNNLVSPRKKNVKSTGEPLESVGFTNHFFDAVNKKTKRGTEEGVEKTSKIKFKRQYARAAIRNADNVMPFMGGFFENPSFKKKKDKDKKRKRK